MRTAGRFFLTVTVCLSLAFTVCIPSQAADFFGKKVTAVSIAGNVQVPESTIMAVVHIKPGDALSQDTVKQDMQSIYELGNFVNVVVNFTQVPEGVKVIYTVEENPTLLNVVVQGNTKVPTAKITEMITAPKNRIVNTETISANIRAIEQYYHDQGYMLAKVSDVAMGKDGVLTLTISEGMLEAIEVSGNTKTKARVVTREMKVKPGQPLNVKDLKRSMQKVYNLGFFEDVNTQLKPGAAPNSVILDTKVVEQKTGVFTIGGGYSSNDGMIGILELGDNNFRGTGDSVNVHWEFGGDTHNRNYNLSYNHPWLDSKQTSLGLGVYNMTNQYTDYVKGVDTATYDKKRRGWNISLGRPQGDYVTNSITLKSNDERYSEYLSGENYSDGSLAHQQYLKDNFGLTRSVVLNRTYDSRDNIFNASEGKLLSFTTEVAGLGGDFRFGKYSAEGRYYKKIGENHIWAFRVNAGFGTGHLPDSSKYTLGGTDSLRGYKDYEFKGDRLVSGTVEYRFPVAKKVQAVLFTDVGKAWSGSDSSMLGVKGSVGVGLRLSSPLGPIRLDYGKGSEGGRFHFSFGGQF